METPDYLTPAEVAELFKVDLRTVYRWYNTGKLSYVLTPGGRRRTPREAVEPREPRPHTTLSYAR